ncbi:MAG TPA: adenine deaminase [Candidatus Limiplasma sp.]|nr:adenine deaminase [Candidatus Limiplasma sp.]
MIKKHMELEPLIQTAAGRREPDLVFKNAQVINNFTQEVLRADVAVCGDMIAGVGQYSAKHEIDCTKLYLCPGFLDAHCHIESSMTIPAEFSRAVLPSGTTAVIADPHEIVNVCGAKGLQYMLDAAEQAICDIFYMLPSCVPATAFETSGTVFTPEDMKPFLGHPRVLGLAEVMSFPDVVAADPAMMEKIKLFAGYMIDGHAPGLSGNALQAYAAAGIATDHEATTFDEVLEKARAGLAVLIREGSAAHNLQAIVEGIVKNHIPTRRFLFCTDDKHLDDIRRDGHIVHNIRMAIRLGIPPIEAISMATLNTAEYYGLRNRGAIAAGRLADIVLVSDLQAMQVEAVYKGGLPADTLLTQPTADVPVPSDILHSVLLKPVTKCDLALGVSNLTDAIEMIPSQILTNHLREEVPVENGYFQPNDVYAKLCVLERHGKNGNVAIAPLKGYGIQGGAVATSVAHDSHNIIAAGDNDADITLAINHIRDIGGGYTVVQSGQVIGSLPLQAAGLMSTAPHAEVERSTQLILEKAKALHIAEGIDPFISLSFMALPVIPTLRLTDQGLIDLFSS